jgi:hypothetical protein
VTSFFKPFLIFISAIIVLIVILSKTTLSVYINSVTWCILAYFILLTIGFHYGLLLASKGNPQQFIRYYMGATSFKLLIHLGVIIVYCLFHRSEAVRFIISFFIFYLAFTVFEVIAIKKSFKK